MKLFANRPRMLALALICALFASVMEAQSNPYDKFRNREYSNKGYLSEEEEMKMGEQVHQELLKQIRLVEDRSLNDYVNRLGQSLARRSERPNIQWRFYVVNDKTLNAFATLGGRVYVHSGLIATTTNEAQLASVIGHEIGHVKHAHTMSAMRTAYMASAGRKAVAASSGTAAKLADSELGALGEKIFTSQFSQSQETESDDYGLAFMQKHKYNVKALESAFRKLASLSGKQGGLDQMLSSHPDPGSRADRMRDKTGGKKTIRFKNCIIAAGSAAVHLPFIPRDPRIVDSTGALELRFVPKKMLVIGGGIIGLEMATVYSTLGTRIDVEPEAASCRIASSATTS